MKTSVKLNSKSSENKVRFMAKGYLLYKSPKKGFGKQRDNSNFFWKSDSQWWTNEDPAGATL